MTINTLGLSISFMGMDAFDWAAIIGAAAWVPQVITWLIRYFDKPKLRVITSQSPEIGYTSFGPIFNLTCSLSAERKDAVIERIVARLKHENGQSSEFRWSSLKEKFSEVRSAEGIVEVTKNQPAVALKVSTLVLTEKTINMLQPHYDSDYQRFFINLIGHHSHLKKNDPHFQENTLKSKEFAAIVDFTKKHFIWQEGKYEVHLELRIAGVETPTLQSFRFEINKIDVERLRENLSEIERYLEDLIRPPQVLTSYHWNWAYPLFLSEQ